MDPDRIKYSFAVAEKMLEKSRYGEESETYKNARMLIEKLRFR